MTDRSYLTGLCDCGKAATRLCADIQPEGITLVRCLKPVCGTGSIEGWCAQHRHESGTMGYMGQMKASASYEGEVYDEGDGLWGLYRIWWRSLFYSKARIAQHVWDRLKAQEFKPPRPLPERFELNVKGIIFELHGDTMVEREKVEHRR